MFTCEWKTLTYPKGASPKHATGQPSCKSSRTSSPHFRIASNHPCAMAPNSPECSFIHASIAGSRSTAPLNRSNFALIVAPRAPQNSLAVEELRARDFIYFNLLFERSCDFCLNNRRHENIQRHRLSYYFFLRAGLYVFRPGSFGTLDRNVGGRNLFHLLLVSWRAVLGRCSSFGNRTSLARL